MNRFSGIFLAAIFSLLQGTTLDAQTVLISPTGAGGFENGATFADNGWTVANDATNAWYVGSVPPVYGGTRVAYVSNDGGTTWAYTISPSAQVSHFYRDVTFPAGETSISLSFVWQGQGEGTTSAFDYLAVYVVPTTTTPTPNVLLSSGQVGASYRLVGTYTPVTIIIPGSHAGTTQRLVFSWRNDASLGTQPPAAVDSIALVSQVPVPLSGTYTINNTLPTGGTNFASFTAAFNALNVNGVSSVTTFNVSAGQTFIEDPPSLSATGTVTNTITFQRSGAGANPVIQPTGTTGTTDAAVNIAGGDYITFDGIDVNVASGVAVEYGYYITNASATDGAQYNTIKNTTINLNNTTTAGNTSSAGVRFNTATTPTSAAGTNSYNTIKNITTRNSYRGILFSANATNRDEGNTVTADPGYSTGTNTVGYNDIGNTTISQSSGFRGIEINGQNNLTISKCEVRNMANTNTTTTSDLVGIIINSTSTSNNLTITQNLINNITSVSTGTQVVYGMWFNGACAVGTSTVSRNKIWRLRGSSTSTGTTRGILYNNSSSTATGNLINNMIFDLQNPASTGTPGVRGIELNSAFAVNMYYNTVHLAATTTLTTTSFQTGCLYISSSTNQILDMRNNILANNSSTTPTGSATRAVAFYKTTTTIGTQIATTSNNNLLWAGTPSTKNLLFYGSTGAGDQTLAGYRTSMGSPRELQAVTANPAYTADSLHIDGSVPSPIEKGGTPVGSVADDYDGNARDANFPDIGADEFTGTLLDQSSPAISHTQLDNTGSTANRTAIATIMDATGVPTGGGLVPRIYYKKMGAGSYFSQPGTLGSGSGTVGTWNFTINVADLGGVTVGDSIYYYFIAQDGVGTPNLGSLPGGAAATDVNTVSTPPSTQFAYRILGTITGNKTVGTAGGEDYATLKAAFDALNGAVVTGNVTLTITSNTTETASAVLNPVVYDGGPWTITIKPSAALSNSMATPTIAGSIAGAVIRLDGADNVTIDGSNAIGGTSKDLTIQNLSTASTTAAIWISSKGAGAGATNITIKNCNIAAGSRQDTAANTTFGILMGGASLATSSAGENNDNNTFTNNSITKARYGIYCFGGSVASNTGLVITNNIIGPASHGADQIGKGGIVIASQTGPTVSQNEIRFVGGPYLLTSGGTDRVGIALATDAAWTPTTTPVKNAVITRNLVHDIRDERTFSAVGIVIGGTDAGTTNNLIANNMLYNILANGTASDQTAGIGISAGNGDKVVFNTIYLTGDTDPDASATTPSQSNYGVRISSTSAVNLSLRNNILYQDLSSSSAPTLKNACIDLPASYAWGTGGSNNNDLYYLGTNAQSYTGSVGNTSGTFSLALADWQTASSQDANSVYQLPVFTSSTDLHLAGASLGDPILKGIPIAGVGDDFDGQARDTQAPYMGADEATPPLPVQIASFSARVNSQGAGVRLDWRTISELNNYGFYIQRKRDGDAQFIELANSFVAGNGTTSQPHDYSYVDGTIAQTGLYYYRLRQVDLDGSSNLTEPVSVSVSSLTSVPEEAPREFALFQNYPNPFNPSTEIKFSVENDGKTTLEVYNLLGQKIATLFNEIAEAGRYYRVRVNATNFATGMYIYRLQSGSRVDVKKMLLMK